MPVTQKSKVAKVKDTRIGEGAGYVPLGEGNIGIENFVKRLLGIGFDGFLTVEWDRMWLPALTSDKEYLPQALQKLRDWLAVVAENNDKGLATRAKAEERAAKTIEKALAKASEAKSPPADAPADATADATAEQAKDAKAPKVAKKKKASKASK